MGFFHKEHFEGIQAAKAEEFIPETRSQEEIKRGLEFGLEAAESIKDRNISCFSRGINPYFAGINTFLKLPYLEDVRKVGEYDVAFMGVPHDIGTTYRPGTRFGPQALRRISALYSQAYSYELAVDLRESLKMCDVGDVFTIPANNEKSFDQISKAVSHVFASGAMPVMMGGDHSIGYPCVRGVAPHIDGNIGIIHLDRHADTMEKDMDERMHTCPWFHATNIPNAPATNLVQIGIGGWQVARGAVKVARERNTTIISVGDAEKIGIEKVAEIALEMAWKGAKAVYLSFDVDCVDASAVPGTGYPEPGGFTPREALKLLQLVAKEGICAMEVVEVAPQYDISDITAMLGVRAILEVLGVMVLNGKIGSK
ncbi:Agmatinase [Desulfotomaculum nigrificans CO-1-SRB]|uniref:Agmatinase n=1 Tax=Desulfotomaculum nigrificans (strain DSM 14880 / VKM B-2319 / CO-1-SRB) TaxID=868595 RepID=F6B315_DESCC|nr:agmatinase family protein [Desulfotomaculum nigrificans]AEF93919.1 Agmatinase [Desulfotomaculum nigrificans CO-1-SRB]